MSTRVYRGQILTEEQYVEALKSDEGKKDAEALKKAQGRVRFGFETTTVDANRPEPGEPSPTIRKLTEEELDGKTVDELRALAAARQLTVKGAKDAEPTLADFRAALLKYKGPELEPGETEKDKK